MFRYDARLLLDELPPCKLKPDEMRLSPTGWSDLPSDTEDTFFLAPSEVEDYHRHKRRRILDQNREDRLRAIRSDEKDEAEAEEWGGSDEEVHIQCCYI